MLGWQQRAARPPATTCLAFAVSIKPRLVHSVQSSLAGRSKEKERSLRKLHLQIAALHHCSPKLNQNFSHLKQPFGIVVPLIQ